MGIDRLRGEENPTRKRNRLVREYLDKVYEKAIDEACVIDDGDYRDSLEALFCTDVWGFREIMLVVLVGMHLNVNYRASEALYACNPRAIYEGPIKEFLIEKNIPHRKSGPLNIAKATPGLDMEWAKQRRPVEVAEKVVRLVRYLEEEGGDTATRVDNVAVSLLRKLITYTNELEELSVEIEPSRDPVFLAYLCHRLINEAPDAGNTPQRIAAMLLKSHNWFYFTDINVTGGEDRASVTSTTSNKPGDINEEGAGRIYKVYEITVKPFNLARIHDSYDCISIYNREHHTQICEVIVVCRPEDCIGDMVSSGLHGCMGYYDYQEVRYYYWNIHEWIDYILQHMTPNGREGFYLLLNHYVNDINTAESVKRLWRDLHTGL